MIAKEFDVQRLQTLIEKERGLNSYKDFQLKEREGLIEANNLLQLERNDLADKLNNHRHDIDDAKSEAAKARTAAEVMSKQNEEKAVLIDKYH